MKKKYIFPLIKEASLIKLYEKIIYNKIFSIIFNNLIIVTCEREI